MGYRRKLRTKDAMFTLKSIVDKSNKCSTSKEPAEICKILISKRPNTFGQT